MFTLASFDYALPRGLIAAHPCSDRTGSRLLYVRRKTGRISHHIFRGLADFLAAGDLLVLNDTRVIPARLIGVKPTGGKVEALLLKESGEGVWEALLKPGARTRQGSRIIFGENGIRLEAEVLEDSDLKNGIRRLRFQERDLREALDKIGHMPLPPYLDRPDTAEDRERYQTVFAKSNGAVAAPTAGLHFDMALLKRLRQKGVQIAFVTLHVGYGTFRPITVEDVRRHRMDEEPFEISEEAAALVNRARRERRRIVACGTTTVRALESTVSSAGILSAGRGTTTLFIYPPYRFKIVSGLITNFHLPKSTLLLLVAAFVGRRRLMEIYAEAIRERYRFYSYGDAMLIL